MNIKYPSKLLYFNCYIDAKRLLRSRYYGYTQMNGKKAKIRTEYKMNENGSETGGAK